MRRRHAIDSAYTCSKRCDAWSVAIHIGAPAATCDFARASSATLDACGM
jgi:hypothetical protein